MMRRLTVALGVVGLTLAVLSGPAPAQPPDAQGWWWLAGSPLALTPPSVPEDGLYVASNPTGPEAVSALRFTVAGPGGAGTLTLVVAGETRGTPIVGACALAEAWEPAQGGAMIDAPGCDPDGVAVPGTVADDGTSVTFPVASLVGGGELNIGIVPGTDESGGNPTFQLALNKPGPEALAPASEPETSGDTPPSEPVFEPSFSAPPEAPAGTISEPDLGIPRPAAPRPSSPTPVAAPATGVAAPVSATRDDDGDQWRIVGIVLLAATAVAYHRLSTMTDREPQSLISFGTAAEEGG